MDRPLANFEAGRLWMLDAGVKRRFFARVEMDPNGGCWLWSGATSGAGYGQMGVGRREDGSRKIVYTHRLSYEHFFGPVPSGMFVCHKCDVRTCCNPAHLFCGTQSDNMKDASSKGRVRNGGEVGSQKPNATMSEETVRGILVELKTPKKQTEIATAFGVSAYTVSNIKLNKSWKHVEREG